MILLVFLIFLVLLVLLGGLVGLPIGSRASKTRSLHHLADNGLSATNALRRWEAGDGRASLVELRLKSSVPDVSVDVNEEGYWVPIVSKLRSGRVHIQLLVETQIGSNNNIVEKPIVLSSIKRFYLKVYNKDYYIIIY
ncbi:hypothetical protein BDV96DRAFT_608388 [Lophiotrema nucula]|uniref:Uncharacterized protein n=1 Tax=Lophiotrema nucula TaxID=690887 RepID=A0A6A5YED9_9PLEO|nr:hypothetical protein BDV96DRAFT_608388 [Lophiotrema nucula]